MSTLNYTKDFNLKRSLPLGKQIYNKLRDKIIYTELFPLTEIFESDLANKLNVSRTPIRDALKKLENDGLVETIPQVKSVVSKINVKTKRCLHCFAARDHRRNSRPTCRNVDRPKTLCSTNNLNRTVARASRRPWPDTTPTAKTTDEPRWGIPQKPEFAKKITPTKQ